MFNKATLTVMTFLFSLSCYRRISISKADDNSTELRDLKSYLSIEKERKNNWRPGNLNSHGKGIAKIRWINITKYPIGTYDISTL